MNVQRRDQSKASPTGAKINSSTTSSLSEKMPMAAGFSTPFD